MPKCDISRNTILSRAIKLFLQIYVILTAFNKKTKYSLKIPDQKFKLQ